MIRIATISLGLLASAAVSADFQPNRLAHTYSIVCYDSATGQFGAAVQSHWFKVADVIWAEAGVGAVATQSLVDFSYGPLAASHDAQWQIGTDGPRRPAKERFEQRCTSGCHY